MKEKDSILKAGGVSYVLPFILITTCFALWGFANDITNPMVKAFSKIFRMSVTQGSLVQVAFYGGYFCMALPAAMFIRKFSYKAGVLVGLGLYALGALLFLPAKSVGVYGFFLIAYFIMTCGLSFLETSCNPYILSMGTEEDFDPSSELRPVLQSDRLADGNVRGDELHPGEAASGQHGRAGASGRCELRGDETG